LDPDRHLHHPCHHRFQLRSLLPWPGRSIDLMEPSLLPPPPTGWPPPPLDRGQVRARSIGQGAAVAAVLGTALLALRATPIPTPPCPMRAVTGVPCPGCGMTRLADAVAHGHL